MMQQSKVCVCEEGGEQTKRALKNMKRNVGNVKISGEKRRKIFILDIKYVTLPSITFILKSFFPLK